MAGIETFTNITKISDSLYEVTGGDAILDSTLDALVENVTIVMKDGGWLIFGSSLTSTFERCTIVETSTAKILGVSGANTRFAAGTSPVFKGCHFIVEHGVGRGRAHFCVFPYASSPVFTRTDYGEPCRLTRIIPDGADTVGNNFFRYGTFDGFVVTAKSPTIADFSVMRDTVNLVDIDLTGANSRFQLQPNDLSNYKSVAGVGGYDVSCFQYYTGTAVIGADDEWGNLTGHYTMNNSTTTVPIKTFIFVDSKGWIRQSELDHWGQKSNIMFRRTFRSTPVDPTTLNAVSVKGYLKNADSGRVYVSGETTGIDEQLLQYRYRAYTSQTGKQVSNTDADGNLIATGNFLIFEDHYIRGFIAYDKLPSARNFQVVNNENGHPTEELVLMADDSAITETNKGTVDAYTELESPEKFYDRAKSYLYDNYVGETATIVSRSGNTINAGSYNITVDASAASVFAFDGTTITIKATQFVGNITSSGTFTLLNGAEILGTYGSTTVLPWSVTNVEAGSTIQIYNVTQSIEIENYVTAGSGTKITATGSYSTSDAVAGDTIRLRVTCQVGTAALIPFEQFGVATSAGISMRADQVDDDVYNANNIDGSSITGITLTPDYTNIQIDVDDQSAPYEVSAQQIYNYYAYLITTSQGIANFYGAITPIDNMNYKINSSVVALKIQNTGTSDVVINGGRLYRDDNVSIIDTSSGTGAGTGSLVHDTGFLLQYIQAQVEAAVSTIETDVASIKKKTNLISSLV